MRKLCLSLGFLLVLSLVSPSFSADYLQIATLEELASVATPTPTGVPTTIGGVALTADGSTGYAVIKRTTNSYSWIVKISNFAQPSQTISMFYDWGASNLNMGQALYISGDSLIIGDGTDDTIYKIELASAARSVYLSKAQLIAQSGVSAPNLQGNNSGLTNNGELVFYQSASPTGHYVTTGPGTITSFLSVSSIISSAIAFDPAGNAYWGNNSTGGIIKYDGTDFTEFVSANAIKAVSGATSTGFVNFRYNAADGKIYFRESGSGTFMSVEVANPALVETVLTNNQLTFGLAGGTQTIGPFNFCNGNLVWSRNPTGIFMIPEPLTLSLLSLGGLSLLRRR